MKARYIAFEGGEGSGKSTVTKLVKEELEKKGKKVLCVREPGTTELAEDIRNIIFSHKEIASDTEISLFLVSRLDLINKVIIPSIEEYDYIISDRSYITSVIYQGYCGGLGVEKTLYLHDLMLPVKPDKVLFFDIEPEIALKRKSKEETNKFEEMDMAFHKKVYNGYDRLVNRGIIERINARNTPEEITESILEKII